nr:retrotransposon Orf1 [Tanacetum cinerariifolium]
MEAHLAPKQPVQVNKVSSSGEIYSGPHDTEYCMENPEQAFVEYASSRTDKEGGKWFTFKLKLNNLGDTYNPSWKSHPNLSQSDIEGLVSNFMASQDARLSKFEADFKQQQSEMTNKIDTVLKAITDRITGALPSDTVKNPKLNIMRRKLNPRDDPNRGVSNFTGRTKGMHVFIGYFTYVIDFMIVEDISSIIDPSLSQVVLGKPFVEMINMTHDLSKGVVRFINGTNKNAYKMPHKIEQYNSLSDLEKEHKKSIYLRNEEDKRR